MKSYTWDFGDGHILKTSNATAKYNYPSAGKYQPTLLMHDESGCPTAINLIENISIDTVNMKIGPSSPEVCLGQSVQLTVTGGSSYSWTQVSGLNNYTIAAPLASPQLTTTFKVEVTNESGCKKSDSIQVVVRQPITVNLVADTFVCAGSAVTLQGTGATTYTWIKTTSGLSQTQGASTVARPMLTSLYTLVGADAYKCFTDTAEVKVNVKVLPTVNAGPDMEVPGGNPVPLRATASSDVIKWNWSPSANVSCTQCSAPMANPGPLTAYIVKVENQFGCVASDTMFAKLVCEENKILIPNSFTPNNDGKNDIFSIRSSGTFIMHFRIFGRWGDVLYERNNFSSNSSSAGWDGTAKGNPVPDGTYVYFIQMRCATGEIFTRKGTITLLR
jgi:gliding motility-associated-like protein